MFRNLIPMLADRFHVVAPDYPGFGQGSAPSSQEFTYTFDNLTAVIDKFTGMIGLNTYSLYVQYYRAPISAQAS
jgi:pimeloyl-ACP methyl ester carboxylesterase